MAELPDERRKDEIAPELPSKYLPGVEYRDLPEPMPARKVIGASAIMLATALGAGEFILWPYVVSQVGLGVLWLAIIGFTFGIFVFLELVRYTMATGETVVTGFTRLWKPWGIILVLAVILVNVWPGWATGSSVMLTFLLGLNASTVPIISVIGLIAIGIALTVSPVVYQVIEKIDLVMITIISAIMVLAVVLVTDLASWASIITEIPAGVASTPQYLETVGSATLLGAAGAIAAGSLNLLVQSNYTRDKGMGMGQRMPKIVSPITGQEEVRPSLGYMMRTDEENLRRWRGWWKVANQEAFFLFYFIGMATLLILCLVVAATIAGQEEAGQDLEFIRNEGEALKNIVAPWFGNLFWFAGFLLLFSTNLGVVDMVSRVAADSMKALYLRESEFWSESKLYFLIAWTMIIGGSIILLSGLAAPLLLVVIGAVGQGVGFVFISALLIRLNGKYLPDAIKLRGLRLVVLIATFLFYAVLSTILLLSYL